MIQDSLIITPTRSIFEGCILALASSNSADPPLPEINKTAAGPSNFPKPSTVLSSIDESPDLVPSYKELMVLKGNSSVTGGPIGTANKKYHV